MLFRSSYDTRVSQPRGRTEKQDEEFIIHPNYLRGMKRGEAVCRIVYVSGPKVFKMKLKEVKAPPSSFDYVQCVPIRDNHLRKNESNKIENPKALTRATTNSQTADKKGAVKNEPQTPAEGTVAPWHKEGFAGEKEKGG